MQNHLSTETQNDFKKEIWFSNRKIYIFIAEGFSRYQMTIKETTKSIFRHPFFKEAMRKFAKGDPADLMAIFDNAQIHVYQTVVRCATKEYGRNKWGQVDDIRVKISELPPPTTLDLYLPIPLPDQPELPFGNY